MKYSKFLSCLTLVFIVSTGPRVAVAEDVIKETPSGGINWTQGIVYAHGYGTAKENLSAGQKRILSRRAAIVDGQRNLLEITKGVRINSVVKTDEAMKESREIATRVEGVIKGAQPIKEHYQNDVYTVTMAMPISGDFLKILYEKEDQETGLYEIIRPGFRPDIDSLMMVSDILLEFLVPSAVAADTIVITTDEEAEAYKKLLEWMKGGGPNVDTMLNQAIINYETNSQFSGLLIDASSVANFELATVPTIRDEEGNVLYPSPQTSYDDIVNKRGVTYDFDLQDAVRNKRVATTPFKIQALSTYKNLPSDLVITKADAERVKLSPSTVTAMNKAGVLIVVAI
jgi:hypothetical protein